MVGRTRWDGPGINSVWFRGEVEPGRPPREYLREMRGDPVPQNFTDGVHPRWDEPRARAVEKKSDAEMRSDESRTEASSGAAHRR